MIWNIPTTYVVGSVESMRNSMERNWFPLPNRSAQSGRVTGGVTVLMSPNVCHVRVLMYGSCVFTVAAVTG